MAVRLGPNIAALNAQRRLSESTAALESVFERLSSGQRINRASDDAAGLAISETLKSDQRVFTQAGRNVNDAISMLNLVDGALEALSQVLTRGMELAEQGANGSYTSKQRKALDKESKALTEEFNRIIQSVSFNQIKPYVSGGTTLNIQAGYGNSAVLSINLGASLSRIVGDGTFGSNTQYNSANSIAAVETADLNNDGKLDLIASNYSGFSIGVYFGNGDGSFLAPRTYSSNSTITSLVLDDINGDGVLDMVTATKGGGNVISVYLGNNGGSFKASTDYVTGTEPTAELGDLNGDGRIDIAVASRGNSLVQTLIGNGDGTFSYNATYNVGGAASDIVLSDFNSDGILDIATSQELGARRVGIMIGNGDGTFRAQSVLPIGGALNGISIVSEDFNDDGNQDIAVSGDSAVTIFHGNGDGTFSQVQQNAITYGASLEISDLNGDGIFDLAFGMGSFNQIGVMLGNATGTFQTAVTISASRVEDIAIGDFNGDGAADFAAGDFSANGIDVYLAHTTNAATIQRIRIRGQEEARSALTEFQDALARLSSERAQIGAIQSRLESAHRTLYATTGLLASSYSRIVDTDIAQEAAEAVRLSILQKAGTALLAHASQQPNIALKLLQS